MELNDIYDDIAEFDEEQEKFLRSRRAIMSKDKDIREEAIRVRLEGKPVYLYVLREGNKKFIDYNVIANNYGLLRFEDHNNKIVAVRLIENYNNSFVSLGYKIIKAKLVVKDNWTERVLHEEMI